MLRNKSLTNFSLTSDVILMNFKSISFRTFSIHCLYYSVLFHEFVNIYLARKFCIALYYEGFNLLVVTDDIIRIVEYKIAGTQTQE